jgi:PAP2 superfamily
MLRLTRDARPGSRARRSFRNAARRLLQGVALVAALGAVAAAPNGSVATAQVGPAAPAPGTGSASTIVDWNGHAMQALIRALPAPPAWPSFGLLMVQMAMVQGTVYDAVNAIDGSHQPYLDVDQAPPWYSEDAAAATAAYTVLLDLVPAQRSILQDQYNRSLAAVPEGRAKDGGVRVGERAADAMLRARANDGRSATCTVEYGTEPGVYRPTPPDFAVDPSPCLGDVKPFLVRDVTTLLVVPPHPLGSAAYAQDLNEVKTVGAANSTVRTPDQTDAALWWQSGGFGPEINAQLIRTHGLTAAQAARMLAMENMAEADGLIGCHYNKYYYNYWRPITAIREADTDGNPDTTADPNWTPLIPTPPWPEYTSGHTCNTSGAVHALQAFFGTDSISFSARSPSSGTVRSFSTLSQALEEIIDARVWGGIHFRWADVQGAEFGKAVVDYMTRHYFRPE